MALEASSGAMMAIQDFVFWLPGGVLQLFWRLPPSDRPRLPLAGGRLAILALAMSPRSGVIVSQVAFATRGIGTTTSLFFCSPCTRGSSCGPSGLRPHGAPSSLTFRS